MSETHTTATVRVAIEIDCSGGGWGGACKMEQVHKQAQDHLRGILAKAFPLNGPVKVLGTPEVLSINTKTVATP